MRGTIRLSLRSTARAARLIFGAGRPSCPAFLAFHCASLRSSSRCAPSGPPPLRGCLPRGSVWTPSPYACLRYARRPTQAAAKRGGGALPPTASPGAWGHPCSPCSGRLPPPAASVRMTCGSPQGTGAGRPCHRPPEASCFIAPGGAHHGIRLRLTKDLRVSRNSSGMALGGHHQSRLENKNAKPLIHGLGVLDWFCSQKRWFGSFASIP